MPSYTSVRYLPIRAKIVALLQANANLYADIRKWVTTESDLEGLAVTQLPAVSVEYDPTVGSELPLHTGPFYEHIYNVRVIVVTFNRTAATALDDAYTLMENVENVLRAEVQPEIATGDNVHLMGIMSGQREAVRVETGWYVRVSVGVTVRHKVQG